MDIVLVEAGSLSVTVVGPDGRPVKGAWVSLRWQSRDGRRATGKSELTDESGRAVLEGLEPGEGRLRVDGMQDPEGLRVALDEPRKLALTVAVTVAATVSVTGTVLGADGRPLGDVAVSVLIGQGETVHRKCAQTGRDGRFEIARLPPGEYELSAYDPLRGRVERRVEAPAEVTLAYPAMPALEGVVVDDAGEPQANVGVELSARGGDRRTAVSDAAGRFRVFLTPGVDYELKPSRPGASGDLRVTSQGADQFVKVVVPRIGRVDGVVLDESGEPVPDAEIFWSEEGGPGSWWFAQSAARSDGKLPADLARFAVGGAAPFGRSVARSRADGRFSFECASNGLALAVGVGSQSDQAERVGPDSRAVVLRVSSRPVGAGRVLDRRGRPIAAFSVNHQAFHEPTGRFRVSVPAGEQVEVTVESRSRNPAVPVAYARKLLKLKVQPTDRLVDLGDLVLADAFEIRGVAVQADGKTPVPKAWVAAYVDGEPRGNRYGETRADEQGRFVLRGVPSPKVRVVASLAEKRSSLRALQNDVTPRTPQPLVLRMLGTGSLRVSLVDARTGAPVTQGTLEALGPDDSYSGRPQSEASSFDKKGQVLLKSLDAGPWELVARSTCPRRTEPRFPAERRKVRIEPDTQSELVVRIACSE